jgi:hypothetical protein
MSDGGSRAVTHRGGRRAIWATLALVLLLVPPAPGHADEFFHVAYTVERGGTTPTHISGRVTNVSTVDVFDVYVTAEALDAAGKVLGRGIVFVSPSIPPRGVVPFVASVPAADHAARFRVRVTSFRQGFGQQAS